MRNEYEVKLELTAGQAGALLSAISYMKCVEYAKNADSVRWNRLVEVEYRAVTAIAKAIGVYVGSSRWRRAFDIAFEWCYRGGAEYRDDIYREIEEKYSVKEVA